MIASQQNLIAKNHLVQKEELSMAMILHELRTPITTIILALSYLRKINLPEESKIQATLALSEAQHLKVSIDETLTLFRCSNLQLEELELNEAIEETIELIPSIPDAKRRHIKWIPTHRNIWINGDRNKLKQVFINLLTNACQAVEAGETITWYLEPDPTTKQVQIRLHNGGNPIAPEVLSQLTKPFFTTKSDGNGLGLAIVYEIVGAHSGKLQIESNAIFGTTVSVCLPFLITR